jgi:hypothetical protein
VVRPLGVLRVPQVSKIDPGVVLAIILVIVIILI